MKKVDYLIVGAGVSGLTAALTILASVPTAKVLLIDSASEVGGLLRSDCFEDKYFDLGTHIPEKTPNDELNALLYPRAQCQDWHQLTTLAVGNFFSGQLNQRSQFLDVTALPNIAEQVRTELLQLNYDNTTYQHLADYLSRVYGPTLTHHILAPLLFKLTALSLDQLSINAPKYYGLSRIICGDREQSIALKRSAHLDNVLAYADDAENPRKSLWFYPNKGGVGAWVALLEQRIREQGGNFSFKTMIKSLEEIDNVHHVQFQNEEMVQANNIIWTVPVYLGLKAAQQARPLSRAISILHFYTKSRPLSHCHYIYCHDAALQSYRITLYSNIVQSVNADKHRCSVEVIHDLGVQPDPNTIMAELKTMNIFAVDSVLHYAGCSSQSHGFPLPLAGSEQQRVALFEHVCANNPKVLFIGRAKPQLFFMTDVLVDSYLETKNSLR